MRAADPLEALAARSGRCWIRTNEGLCQLIYSQPPLSTWVTVQDQARLSPARDRDRLRKRIPIASVQPEPMMGIEPITYHLQGDCSTIELHRQNIKFLRCKLP